MQLFSLILNITNINNQQQNFFYLGWLDLFKTLADLYIDYYPDVGGMNPEANTGLTNCLKAPDDVYFLNNIFAAFSNN